MRNGTFIRRNKLFLGCLLIMLLSPLPASNADSPVPITFRIKAKDEKPVSGVKVFLYQEQNVRRPADFISPPTAADGKTAVTLPPGKYWAVARLKRDEKYGPLMPGDKHSGEPVELEVLAAGGSETEFTVTDIREAGEKRRTEQTDTRVVTGRVVTTSGSPVAGVWVYAHRARKIEDMPEYISAWTDSEGRYQIHVAAREQVYLGVARAFPPAGELLPSAVADIGSNKIDIALDVALPVK